MNRLSLICCATSFICASCHVFVPNETTIDNEIPCHAQEDLSLNTVHEFIGIYQLDEKAYVASTGMDPPLVDAIVIGAEHRLENPTQPLKKQVQFILTHSYTYHHFEESKVEVFECFYSKAFTLSTDDVIVTFRTNHQGAVIGIDVQIPHFNGDVRYFKKVG